MSWTFNLVIGVIFWTVLSWIFMSVGFSSQEQGDMELSTLQYIGMGIVGTWIHVLPPLFIILEFYTNFVLFVPSHYLIVIATFAFYGLVNFIVYKNGFVTYPVVGEWDYITFIGCAIVFLLTTLFFYLGRMLSRKKREQLFAKNH